jgi:hypothetical protein
MNQSRRLQRVAWLLGPEYVSGGTAKFLIYQGEQSGFGILISARYAR